MSSITLSMMAASSAQRTELANAEPLDGRMVVYDAGKKGLKSITAEGAIFKGGKALKALRTVASEVALSKVIHGRYRAACDIIAAGASASHLAGFEKFVGTPWVNKLTMTTYCHSVLNEKPKSAKGWNEKQLEARELANAVLVVLEPAFDEGTEQREGDTIENGTE